MADGGDTDQVTIEEEEVPLAVMAEEEDDTEVTQIEDETTPLASGGAESVGRRFWWWVLAIVAAITGKTSYDKKNKKGIFAEKTVDENSENSGK